MRFIGICQFITSIGEYNILSYLSERLRQNIQDASKAKDIIINNLNIGHDRHFTDAHKELLGQYYDASKLILHCLNQNSAVSSNVKCEIEQTLLLPIAKIEKRNREKDKH
ncbi:hypothetical protein QUA07_02505 [Microcoleus sp. T3_A4]